MECQWNKCYSIGTNRTNGRVECTPTQPGASRNILSPHNEMHFTNGILIMLYVDLCCTMLRYDALCCPMSHYVALHCTMLPYVALCCLKPRQTIATFQRNISQHYWVQHTVRVWPACCNVLPHVATCSVLLAQS